MKGWMSGRDGVMGDDGSVLEVGKRVNGRRDQANFCRSVVIQPLFGVHTIQEL